jgi:hypothetical protein
MYLHRDAFRLSPECAQAAGDREAYSDNILQGAGEIKSRV